MSEVNAEGLNVAAVAESSKGASPPPTTGWQNLECDAVGDPGASYKKQARNPYTKTRQLRRPFVSGMDATLTLDIDAIKDHIDFFGSAIFKADWLHAGGTDQSAYVPTAVAADGFTVASNGALADGTLVVSRGLAEDDNNGVFVCASAAAGKIAITGAVLVVEADPPNNAIVEVCGFQFAEGDAELDADGNLITTTKDLRELDLQEHQFVYFGSSDEVDPPHHFATADYHGLAEVLTIAQHKITFRRRGWTVAAADDGASKTIRMFFTKWIRNVARGHDDENMVSHAFEVTYPGLAAGPADAYELLLGYELDQATFDIPSEGKVAMQMTFVGRTVSDPSTSRVTGPSVARDVVTELALSTSADFLRLSCDDIDENGLMTDFESLKIVFKNNVSGQKTVGHLGNRFVTVGTFEAQTEAEVILTTPDIVTAVRDNRVLRLAAGMRNDDFGMVIDIPATGAMESPKKIDHNKLITISSKIAGFMDPKSAFTAGLSVFAFLPRQAPGLET